MYAAIPHEWRSPVCILRAFLLDFFEHGEQTHERGNWISFIICLRHKVCIYLLYALRCMYHSFDLVLCVSEAAFDSHPHTKKPPSDVFSLRCVFLCVFLLLVVWRIAARRLEVTYPWVYIEERIFKVWVRCTATASQLITLRITLSLSLSLSLFLARSLALSLFLSDDELG